MTKNLRELHLALVNNIILPRLEETLSNTLPKETTECQPNEGSIKLSNAECFDLLEKEFLLRRFAVKMLGVLFRSRTGEAEKRHHLIDLLQNVATSAPHSHVIRDWVFQKEEEGIAEESISLSEFLRGEVRFSLHGIVISSFFQCFTHRNALISGAGNEFTI